MFLNAEKEHTPGFEPSTFGFRIRSPTTGPLFLLIRMGSSLIINLRVNNFKSKCIIAYAFHSQIIYYRYIKQGFPYAIGFRVNQCSYALKKTHTGARTQYLCVQNPEFYHWATALLTNNGFEFNYEP